MKHKVSYVHFFKISYTFRPQIKEPNKIGVTLIDFYYEILNSYSDLNIYKTSNAISEGNNNKITYLIKISYGLKDFARLRKKFTYGEYKKI